MEESEKRQCVKLSKNSIYGDFLNNSVNLHVTIRTERYYDKILKKYGEI